MTKEIVSKQQGIVNGDAAGILAELHELIHSILEIKP